MRKFLASAALIAVLLPSVAAAQSSSSASTTAETTSKCVAEIFASMAHHQRLHRIVLFGRSEEAGQNEVRYDTEGAAWIRTDGKWRSRAAGKDQQSLSDSEMNDRLETDPTWKSKFFRGIFSTKTHITSELSLQ